MSGLLSPQVKSSYVCIVQRSESINHPCKFVKYKLMNVQYQIFDGINQKRDKQDTIICLKNSYRNFSFGFEYNFRIQ